MDVGYKNGDGGFSLRAAALIIDDDRILLAKSDNHDCFYTVGGEYTKMKPPIKQS